MKIIAFLIKLVAFKNTWAWSLVISFSFFVLFVLGWSCIVLRVVYCFQIVGFVRKLMCAFFVLISVSSPLA